MIFSNLTKIYWLQYFKKNIDYLLNLGIGFYLKKEKSLKLNGVKSSLKEKKEHTTNTKMEKINLDEIPKTDSLGRLKNRLLALAFLLGLLVLFSTKISKYIGIEESSWVFKYSLISSIFLGIIYLIFDNRYKKLTSQLDNFNSLLQLKEDFEPIFREVLTNESRYDFQTKTVGNNFNNLPENFSIMELENYIIKWKKIPSIFSYKINYELKESSILLLIFPYNTIKEIARLLGSRKFSRLFLKSAIQHGFITVSDEKTEDNKLKIVYELNKTYTEHYI